MASVNYNSFKVDLFKANINLDTDTLKAMLVTSAYTPDVDAHNRRDDVTNEVTGTGYTAGGEVIPCVVSQDNATNKAVATFSDVTWPTSTITARGAVIYKSRGGASSADELVGYVDFGADKSSVGGDFTLTLTAPLDLG